MPALTQASTLLALLTLLKLLTSSVSEYLGYKYPEPPVCEQYLRTQTGTAFYMRTPNGSAWIARTPDFPDRLMEAGWNSSRKIFLIIHGFNSNVSSPWVLGTQQALLEDCQCNVFAIDWKTGEDIDDGYSSDMAKDIMDFVGGLHYVMQADPDMVHLIGSGLGAHLAGSASRKFENFFFSQIGKITALNPSDKGFDKRNWNDRLTTLSANFVVTILTGTRPPSRRHRSFGGIAGNIGGVNFFANGGSLQPGCRPNDFQCDHDMAKMLFVKSIQHPSLLYGVPCTSYDELRAGRCTPCIGSCVSLHHRTEFISGQLQLLNISDNVRPTGNYYLMTPNMNSLQLMRMTHLNVVANSNQSSDVFKAQLRFNVSNTKLPSQTIDLTRNRDSRLNEKLSLVALVAYTTEFELKIKTKARVERVSVEFINVKLSYSDKFCRNNPPIGRYFSLEEDECDREILVTRL